MAATACSSARVGGPLLEAQLAHPGPDRPGTDQRHAAARLHDLMQFLGERGDAILIRAGHPAR